MLHTHEHSQKKDCDLPQRPYQSALVVITLRPISWPWWLARAECSRCHGLPAGTDWDLLFYLWHTPCPALNENASDAKAFSTLLLPLHFAEWEDQIPAWKPWQFARPNVFLFPLLSDEVLGTEEKLCKLSQPGSRLVTARSAPNKLH